ncbi:Smad nuclear-interacting protein 1 [Trypanosoma grayi]|uniref:Smad nuclear-interacting protein 1 n=1 Tax=Trypanosoma grayi TaxID=71804 RepID=UPI0004F4596A|nr:Smad nuclear-interacting protein 1 [Trypanosoma grayi]KEG09941.1 Smad nuclear-interacting protein 1 [Trypanosoma grayi]
MLSASFNERACGAAEMETPFYGRTGALDGAYHGMPVTTTRFASSKYGKWFPSLLTVPQRILKSITEGDGIDRSILEFLSVACVYEELRSHRSDSTDHGALLRDVLKWHRGSLCAGYSGCAATDADAGVFQPYVPAYNVRVLKDSQPVASYTAVSRRAVTLLGKDRAVNDIPLDHPSCSAQHAAFEVRFVYANAEELHQRVTALLQDGCVDWGLSESVSKVCARVREMLVELGDGEDAWLMELQVVDLGSTNGTRLNGELLRPFVPATVIESDVLTFGFSTRSYVVVRR